MMEAFAFTPEEAATIKKKCPDLFTPYRALLFKRIPFEPLMKYLTRRQIRARGWTKHEVNLLPHDGLKKLKTPYGEPVAFVYDLGRVKAIEEFQRKMENS